MTENLSKPETVEHRLAEILASEPEHVGMWIGKYRLSNHDRSVIVNALRNHAPAQGQPTKTDSRAVQENSHLIEENSRLRGLLTREAKDLRDLWIALDGGPTPQCRDCADEDGTCPRDKLPCDPQDRALKQIEALRSASVPPHERADYSAWLIEINQSASVGPTAGPIYFHYEYDDDWTTDHDKATHFARKQDAQSVIDHYGWTEAKPVEHMWPSPRSQEENAPDLEALAKAVDGLAVPDRAWLNTRLGELCDVRAKR